MRRFFALALLAGIFQLTFAQDIELIPYSSYHWGGKLYLYEGDIKFQDSENYGVALNVNMPTGTALQLEYLYQPTSIDVHDYYALGSDYQNYEVNMNWFQIGGMQQVQTNTPVVPFGGLTLGATYFSPRTNEIEDVWKFSFTGQVGLKYYINEKIGIRLHLGMLVPIQWAGMGLYFGSGGASAGVSGGSSIIQGMVGGGLIFRLNTKSTAPTTAPVSAY